MNINISSLQIEFARQLLKQCYEVIASTPPSNIDDEMRNELADLQKLTAEMIHKLEKPTLRLAFIGATSSGKSTLVNALIGKTLMPTEADEMSAGVVQLFDAEHDYIDLQIAPPSTANGEPLPDGLWQPYSGGAEEKETEQKLRTAFYNYHEQKKLHSGIVAPAAQIRTKLHLAQDKRLLELPDGVQLEIIDLPGVKAINDAANLKVVQESLKKAVLIVVVDYNQLAVTANLNDLLKEIGEVISTFQSTDSIFFVLNKIDCFNKGDKPLNQTIKSLADRIQPLIKTDNVVIDPISAIKLNLYQTGLYNFPNLSDEQIKLFARALWKCEVSLDDDWYRTAEAKAKQVAKFDEGLESGAKSLSDDERQYKEQQLQKKITEFRKLFASQNDEPVLSKERMTQILNLAWTESQGLDFANSLAERVRNHLPRLVIQPAVHDWQVKAEHVLAKVRGDVAVALENTKEALERLIGNLEETQKALSKQLQNINKQLNDSFTHFLNLLRDPTAENDSASRDFVKDDRYLKPLAGVQQLLEEIKKKASEEIYDTIGIYFKETSTADTLEYHLKNIGCDADAAYKFSITAQAMRDVYKDNGCHIKRREDDSKAMEWMKQVRDTFNRSCPQIHELTVTFFSKQLRASVVRLEEMLQEILSVVWQDIYNTVKDCLMKTMPDNAEMFAQVIVLSEEYAFQQTEIDFDPKKLDLPEGTLRQQNTKEGKWGNIKNWELHLPRPEMLVESWDLRLNNSTAGLCLGLSQWFEKNIEKTLVFLDNAAEGVVNHYKVLCRNQIDEGEAAANLRISEWTEYLSQCTIVQNNLPKLETLITTGKIEGNDAGK